jgi:uncharacterized protein
MRNLLIVVAIVVIYFVARALLRRRRQQRPARTVAANMVRCARCGVHLPQRDAVRGADGWYCSNEHRKAGLHGRDA